MTARTRRRVLALALLALALPWAAGAQASEGPRPRLQLGLQAGVVIDPAPWGIEQVHGAAGALLGCRWPGSPFALSLRPALLLNAGGPLLRLPLVLRVGLEQAAAQSGPPTFGLVLSAGAGTWTGDPTRLRPLVGAGAELGVGALRLCAATTAVLYPDGSDLLVDLLLSWVWEPAAKRR